MRIAIVDFGMGNLFSVFKKIKQLNAEPVIASTPATLMNTDKIIIPGVGHFGKAMENLHASGLYDALQKRVTLDHTPVLGICLGMQLMADSSEEGTAAGLGWIPSTVVKFNIETSSKLKIPQTGWNSVSVKKDSRLLKGLDEKNEFYFLHGYHFKDVNEQEVIATSCYGYEFVSVIENGHIFGTQFHPEKSHDAGLTLLQNFMEV
jgi:glutamine amidotransferase